MCTIAGGMEDAPKYSCTQPAAMREVVGVRGAPAENSRRRKGGATEMKGVEWVLAVGEAEVFPTLGEVGQLQWQRPCELI